MKKFLTLILVFGMTCGCMLFVGCAKVNYMSGKDVNGNIIEYVTAEIDENEFEASDLIIRKNQILSVANNTLSNLLANYRQKINLELTVAQLENNLSDINYYQSLLTHVEIICDPVWNDNTFTCGISFASEDSYTMFYNIAESNWGKNRYDKVKEKWLYNEYYYVRQSGYVINHGLYATLSVQLSPIFPEFASTDTQLSYSHLAQSKRWHSNADEIQYTDLGYVHTWNINGEEQELYFYVKIANLANWYMLAIALGLIVATILCLCAVIVHYVKKRKNNSLISHIIN